jgi:flagellar biogenesis protein FliO
MDCVENVEKTKKKVEMKEMWLAFLCIYTIFGFYIFSMKKKMRKKMTSLKSFCDLQNIKRKLGEVNLLFF